MNILLCGEGVTDVGEKAGYDIKLGRFIWNEGTIPVFIRRILEENGLIYEGSDTIRFICYTAVELAREKRKRHIAGQKRRFADGTNNALIPSAPLSGHSDVAACLIRRARSDGEEFDIVGMFKDTDRETGVPNTSHAAQKKHESTKQEILRGFESENVSIEKCFVAVPIRILENWLLSDSTAIAVVNERGKTPDIIEYPCPEELWGKEVQGTKHPKILLAKELEKCKGGNRSHPEKCLVIAENADLDKYRKKCPSFDEFYNDLIQAAKSVTPN